MAQVDTRHNEKDKLFALLAAQLNPESLKLQIAQTRAKMEPSDIEEVIKEFEAFKATLG